MKNFKLLMSIILAFSIMFTSCSENVSNGSRVGLVTKFSRSGLFIKTWEGELTLTQTGMNSNNGEDFNFSIEKPKETERLNVISILDSAMNYGWKVRLTYHKCSGILNAFSRRGSTNYFIDKIEILNKNPLKDLLGLKRPEKIPDFLRWKKPQLIDLIKNNHI